ncbi:hypothetical protein [Kandleria sp.]|uniref:hypothetical protein n=1 Tax=Kandleria sp. TaxID=2774291 RepID=UPI001B518036|nr:hypothetical protein [Kandleria sp.]MBP3275476.1 hypothetical protein [Kandleria sp.]
MIQKFDGYDKKYDEWFMKNENLFMSELKLFKKALGDIENKRILSVGCGSGLFESYIDSRHIEGIEPSKDMGEIAKKRGVNVIKYGLIEDVDLPTYKKCRQALKKNGKLILLDVPKESVYLLGKSLNTYDHDYLNGVMPALPYPLALASSGVWHSTEKKIDVLKSINFNDFQYLQTLIRNPLYTNEEVEDVQEGYKSGGYVAIIAKK